MSEKAKPTKGYVYLTTAQMRELCAFADAKLVKASTAKDAAAIADAMTLRKAITDRLVKM